MVNHMVIKEEMTELKNVLSSGEIEIPNFWSCVWPGLFVIAWLVIFPLAVFFMFGGLSDEVVFSSVFNLVVGFILFFMTFNVRSLYLSVPGGFRRKSEVLKLLKSKAKCYIVIYMSLNLVLLFFAAVTKVGAIAYYVPNMFILVACGLVFSADIGRYHLSAFTSVLALIKSHKQQGGDE